jgi:hypothetical protein
MSLDAVRRFTEKIEQDARRFLRAAAIESLSRSVALDQEWAPSGRRLDLHLAWRLTRSVKEPESVVVSRVLTCS